MTQPKLTEEERKQRQAERSRRYREKHRDALAEKQRRYKAKNREAALAYNREYKAKNREAILDKSREYNAKNREARAEKQRENYVRNREAALAKQRENYIRNREAIREKQREYRERNASAFRANKVSSYAVTRGLGLEIMAHVATLDDFDRMMFASRLMFRAQLDPKLRDVINTQATVDHFLSDYDPDEEAYLRDTLGPVHYDLPTTSKKGTANHEAAETQTTPGPQQLR